MIMIMSWPHSVHNLPGLVLYNICSWVNLEETEGVLEPYFVPNYQSSLSYRSSLLAANWTTVNKRSLETHLEVWNRTNLFNTIEPIWQRPLFKALEIPFAWIVSWKIYYLYVTNWATKPINHSRYTVSIQFTRKSVQLGLVMLCCSAGLVSRYCCNGNNRNWLPSISDTILFGCIEGRCLEAIVKCVARLSIEEISHLANEKKMTKWNVSS